MVIERTFGGFTNETFGFPKELGLSNTREWFYKNRGSYERHVLEPSQEFVVGMGERLKSLSPKVAAIPKTDKSIFRLYRDTRFSPDKTPYKTHIGILFWEGKGKKLESSGYYLQLNESSIFLGAGLYMFPGHMLRTFRVSVVDRVRGRELAKIIRKITGSGRYNLGGRQYKRVPTGYDKINPNAELLLYNGLYVYYETPLPPEIYSGKFLDYCFDVFREMSPLNKWLSGLYRSQ
jgi:uncharacterized protein (TIGR02453 family)